MNLFVHLSDHRNGRPAPWIFTKGPYLGLTLWYRMNVAGRGSK